MSSDGETMLEHRILVADDEPVVVSMLAQLLSTSLKCPVDTVSDGNEVLSRLEEASYDVLLTDMLMPGCSGIELVSAVSSRWPELDIIVMTAYPMDFPYVDIIKAGASDFIAKPFQPSEMLAKLLRVFKERRLLDELRQEKQRILSDIEEIRAIREAQAVAERKYRSLFEHSMNGMALVDAQERVIRDVNQAFVELTGLNADQLAGVPFMEFVDPSERDRVVEGLNFILHAGQGALAGVRMRSAQVDGWFDINVSFIQVDPEPVLLFAFKDVTEQLATQSRLAEMAEKDGRTGLFRHHVFCARLEAAIVRARRNRQPVTLLFLDVDNFKQCNDRHGHQTGDAILTALGGIITRHIRSDRDDGFRYGGDEFAILLSGEADPTGLRVCERIREDYAKLERHGTSLSIGVAELKEGMSGQDLVRAADDALYAAKAQGKDGIYFSS